MDLQQGHLFGQIALYEQAVINVHELARDKPETNTVFGKPVVGEKEKIAVETAEPVNADPRRGQAELAQARFVLGREMVVSDVGRIADNQIEAFALGRRMSPGEIAQT